MVEFCQLFANNIWYCETTSDLVGPPARVCYSNILHEPSFMDEYDFEAIRVVVAL
jgi:hypothetical protein